MVLYDVQQRTAMAELAMPAVKYVSWSADMSLVAMLKHAIVIANRKLGHACTVHETIRVKSGAWDDAGVFIYTTLNHIKWRCPRRQQIIRTLTPCTSPRFSATCCTAWTATGATARSRSTPASTCSSWRSSSKFDQVLTMIKSGSLCGQSIIAYLQQKGFPEAAALVKVRDATRFVRFRHASSGSTCASCLRSAALP